MRGVVDSADISLNISRETLQQTRQLKAMAKRIEKKITSELQDMRDNAREDYEKFFDHFGRGLKYGIYASYGMKKDDLADLLLFWSAKQGKQVTLAEYAAAMPEGQKAIYYAAGDDRDRLEQDVDEFCLMSMQNYVWTPAAEAADGDTADAEVPAAPEPKTIEFKNVASGDLDLASDEEKKQAEETADANKALLDAMKSALGDAVSKVAVSPLETEAPAVISAEGPVSLEMERVLAEGPEGTPQVGAQRVLELNASP